MHESTESLVVIWQNVTDSLYTLPPHHCSHHHYAKQQIKENASKTKQARTKLDMTKSSHIYLQILY